MFLHIGEEYLIKKNNIIGIFDIENTTISIITREYLTDKEKRGQIVTVNNELPKSFIVTCEKNINKIFITSISSRTLEKRMKR
ncbi:MAG: DUF370 domain-containing protein [Clostridiales bacterium]|nr:DUF370 domain-containing protein [Clostridiales bacterium]